MENETKTFSRTVDTEILIIINSIENLEQKPSFIKIIIEHNSVVLGITPLITLDNDENDISSQIEYSVQLPISLEDWRNIYNLISIPILIKVIESSPEDKNPLQDDTLSTEVKKKGKRKNKIKSSSGSTNIIGLCNLDIQSIFLGETTIREKLIVEAPVLSWNSSAVSWRNLPLLSVTVTRVGPHLIPETGINYLNITIESIYNLPSSFTDSEYECGTIIYIDDGPENIIFKCGKWKKFRDVEKRKQWRTLSDLRNGAKFSKYKISPDYENMQNKFKSKLNLQKIVDSDVPRVEWNYVNRNLMKRSGIQIMQQLIEKHKYWPFQILVSDKNLETGNEKSKDLKKQFYQCYVDLAELLFPGKTRVRAVAQLFTYNIHEMRQKTGLNESIYLTELQKEFKNKDKKYKTSIVSNANNVQHLDSSNNSSFPLINENGDPTFIVIEFELHQPFKNSFSTEKYSEEIMKLIKKTKSLRPYILTSHLVEEQFSDCVKKLTEIITERYQNFIDKNNKKRDRKKEINEKSINFRDMEESEDFNETDKNFESKFCHYVPDELQCFIQYLHTAGEYIDIRNTLKNKIISLLDQKFTSDMYSWDTNKSQDFIARAYMYLVERLHMVLNSTMENQFFTETLEQENLKSLYLYAEEAYMLGNIDEARYYYLTIISNNSRDANAWINYAIFLVKISEIEKAIQCCKEAIVLDSRHKIGLLMYGMLLTSLHKYQDAQLFLESLTAFYPQFAEGWIILNLFYQQIEYHPGLDATILSGEKCFNDKMQNCVSLSFLSQPLGWSTNFCKENEMYLITATLLMKLNLYEFAGLALAQELLNGRSVSFLYYLSVHHFLQNQYESAISHLKEIESKYGLDYATSSLMGHCLYKFGEFEEALNYYEYANVTFNRPEDIHLVHLLMGSCYLRQENYNSAKKIFLNCCKTSPTCETWLGLGIALYHTNHLKEAELALNEANEINPRNSIVWGYLCLLNISFQRYEEFSQCYRQAVKNNLKNTKLWQTITNAMEKLDYSSPIIITVAKNN